MFQPQNMRRTVPDQRFVATLHGTVDFSDAQFHIPHRRHALSDESGRVVLPLFDEPVVVSSNTSQTKLFTPLFLEILIGDADDVREEHRSIHLLLVQYLQTLGSDVGGTVNFVPASHLCFHTRDARETTKPSVSYT